MPASYRSPPLWGRCHEVTEGGDSGAAYNKARINSTQPFRFNFAAPSSTSRFAASATVILPKAS